MKAVICTKYGTPEVLQIQEVSKPGPNDSQILVKVVATAINSGDVKVRSLDVKGFMRLIMRLVLGISKPRKHILGTVFSGVIETIGDKVSRLKKGQHRVIYSWNKWSNEATPPEIIGSGKRALDKAMGDFEIL